MTFEYGLYVRGQSFFHRLDARSKIVWVLITLAFSILNGNYLYDPIYGAIIYFTLIAALVASRPGKFWLKVVAGFTIIVAFFNLMFWPASAPPGGRVIFVIPFLGWSYTEFALRLSLSKMFLVVNPVLAATLTFVTSRPGDLFQALVRWRIPYKVAYIPILSLRFLPMAVTEVKMIMDAQSARALEFQKGSIPSRIRKYVAVFIPLMVRMIRSTMELSVALDSKGFGASGSRTFSTKLRWSMRETFFLSTIMAVYLLPLLYKSGWLTAWPAL